MKFMSLLLCNPYHRCGALVCRGAVSLATIIWMAIILIEGDSLSNTRYGPTLTQYIHEDYIAGGFGVMAVCMLYRLVRQSKPNPFGIVAYFAMFCLWLFVSIMTWSVRPWYSTTLAWVTVGTIMAGFALVANPRKCPLPEIDSDT